MRVSVRGVEREPDSSGVHSSQQSRLDTAARAPPGFVEPCLPSRAERPPSGPGWVHEIKHDGYRLMARGPKPIL